MIPLWLAILIAFVATWFGFFLAALLCAARCGDERLEARERAGLEVELDPLMESKEAGAEPARR